MVEELQPERSLNHMPFTKVMFVLQNSSLEEFSITHLKMELEQVNSDFAKFELTLTLKETVRGLLAHVEYNCDLFDESSIARLLDHYEIILRGIVSGPQQNISRLPMLTAQEQQQLLVLWNDTKTNYPRDSCVHHLFEAQAALSPDAVAIRFDGQTISYRELNARANQLAQYLARFDIGPETLVGVCLERSIDLVVAFLASLKTGAAYVPLDIDYPKGRLAFMFSDTRTPVLLTRESFLEKLPFARARTVCLDRDWNSIVLESAENLSRAGHPADLAYVIYTSGSTGRPKGVAVTHRGIVRLVINTNYISLDRTDRIAMVSNISFDAATFEIWGALLNGGQLVGFSREQLLSPDHFARNLRQQGVTALFLTTALFNQLAAEVPGAFEPLRTLLTGGESHDPKWIRAVLQDRPPQRLLSVYGPTENTTFTSYYPIREVPDGTTNIPIGRPIANTEVYILDLYGNPVPIGVPGELCTGGDGLAEGYFGQPALTAEKFIPHPFRKESPQKYLYRTGDLARYLPDGNIEFLGRIDQQVKIRGFRIELGEIESVLAQHPTVKECVVVVHCQSSGEKRLIAYFTPMGKPSANTHELRDFLAEKLPVYMLPSAFVAMGAFPLTANGKVDRRALAALVPERPQLAQEYTKAQDPVEVQLTSIWEKALGIQPIGIRDRFFDLGGHSLLAVRVIAEIQKVFGKKLRLATIFQAPTIQQLAAILRDEIRETSATTDSSLVEIQGEGSRPPLFLVHGAGGGMFWGYVNLSRHLGVDQPVYAFKLRGLDGGRESERIEEMAAQYLNDLRRLQPRGPYFLGGYCFGGNVAYEMARQLAAQNEWVALLALFNCAPPNSRYTRIRYTPRWIFRFARNLFYCGKYFFAWNPRQRREFFRWKWSLLKKRLALTRGGWSGGFSRVEAGDLVDLSSFSEDQRRTWEAHIRALVDFHPKPYAGRVHLFRSQGHPLFCSFDPSYGWGDFALGGVKVTVLRGAHEKILEEPCVAVLGRELTRSLKAAQAVVVDPGVSLCETAPCNGEPGENQRVSAIAGHEPGSTSSLSPDRLSHDTVIAPAVQQQHLAYWTRQLENSPALLELPGDRPRPAQLSGVPARQIVNLSGPLTEALDQLAEKKGHETFTVLMAAFAALLHRYSGSDDIIIGTVLRRLSLSAVDMLPANALPLRCNLAGNPSFLELMHRVRTIAEDALAHSPIPLARIVQVVCGDHQNKSYAPLFQVMLTLDEAGQEAKTEWVPREFEGENQTGQLDLSLYLVRRPEGLTGFLQYSSLLFDQQRIERLIEHLLTLLRGAVASPASPISDLPLMPEHERNQVLLEWNRTEMEYPAQNTLVDLFDQQVALTPDSEALVNGTCRLTYRELHARASQIARYLSGLGVTRDSLVGIFLERTTDMISAMLGILKAGGAYVPLDAAYPRQRLQAILEDANVGVVLSHQRLLGALPATPAQVVCVDAMVRDAQDPEQLFSGAHGSESKPGSTDLAYVIYTSGSTGKPKGVALEHRGAVALVYWAKAFFSLQELSGVLASTSICFDLSIFEIFVPLCSGGKVILAQNALAVPSLEAAAEITLVNTVPSAMKELLRAKALPDSVKVVNLAGEPLGTELVDKIYAETNVVKVYDLYGPTETTTYSTGSLRRAGAPATIGRPLSNEQVYLLDIRLQPVPIGIPGELCIGGVGLARGYLNQPELTKQKFIVHPFKRDARLYRTGDQARWRSDGCLEYLGRMDHQVKIRGFRIELGEVESALRNYPGVREAAVLAREDNPGDKRLVAYVVARPERTPSINELQSSLQDQLPHYMVPWAFVFLNELPLTPNGKVDRKALPAPKQDDYSSPKSIVLPQNPVEEQLVAIWKEVLHLEQLSTSANFFDVGGHSLLAAQVVGRIRDKFAIDLPLRTLFDAPTVAALAEGIASGRWASTLAPLPPIEPVRGTGSAPVSFVQERLWFLDQLRPGSDAYNVPAALRLKGQLDAAAFRQALKSVISHHEALRTTFQYKDEVLTQVVAPQIALECPVQDFWGGGKTETEAMAWINSQAQRPFDLARSPLIRAALARLNATEHLFVVVMHHTICDGWSLALFFEELGAAYAALAKGHGAPSPGGERLQYTDFAHWQRQTMQGAILAQHLEFWKQTLAEAPESIDLPVDFSASENSDGKAARRETLLEPGLLDEMAGLAHRESTTQFMLLMGALAITLSKWTGQNDITIGTVVAGRTRSEMEPMFGCFMNFLPIRTKIPAGQTGREVLAQVRKSVLEAQSHQDCPFEKIVESVNPGRRLNQNPLYNVALLLQHFPTELLHSDTLEVSRVPVSTEAALLDLRFEAEQTPQGLSLICEFRKDLFEPATIEELLRSFEHVVSTLVRSPQTRLDDFAITPPLESQALVHRNRSGRQTIAIAATFTAEPLAEALRYWLKQLQLDSGIKFAPYNQVFQQLLDPVSLLATNQNGLNIVLLRLTDWQQTLGTGVAQEHTADHDLDRNFREFISGLKIATRRTSNAWLVCFCPASRAILADSRRAESLARMEQAMIAELDKLSGVYLLSSAELAHWYPIAEYDDPSAEELGHVPYTPVFFTALATAIARKSHTLRRPPYKVIVLDCDQTLWCGVCGEDGPKGVLLDAPHEKLQQFMRAQHSAGMLLCLCSKNNEADVLEVFEQRVAWPLRREHFAAWRLNWLRKSENLKSLARQLQLGLDSFILVDDNPVECAEIEANCPEVLVLQLPADSSLIPAFLDHCWAFDRLKVTEEDRRRGERYRQNRQRDELLAKSPSLAEFLEGLELRVEFASMSEAQLPRVSQLTQRTNQFNCTAKRLTETDLHARPAGSEVVTVQVRDRFGDYGLVGVMIYRIETSALAVDSFLLSCRALGRGVEHRMLACLGETARARGMDWLDVHFVRTEKNLPALEFLESVGAAFKQALNGGYVFRFPTGFAAEVAFNPPAEKARPPAERLRPGKTQSGLARPVSGKFARYREMALESSNPVRIHEQVEAATRTHCRHQGMYTAPRTDLERRLCELWQKLLRIDRVGVRDDFFELGGHSLMAVRLFAEIEKAIGQKLPLVTLFQAPTVEQLAAVLHMVGSQKSSSLLVPIQPHGARSPLFLVHGAGGDVLWGYANLAAHLPSDQPIYGIKSRGQVGLEEFSLLPEMASWYLQVVREFQPDGPYYLGGYCFGGNVAYEMARQLYQQGQVVALVALIDSAPANAGYENINWWRADFPGRFVRNFSRWLQDFAALETSEQRNFVARKFRSWGRLLKHRFARHNSAPCVDLEAIIDPRHFPEHELKLWQIHLQALIRHVEGTYPGQVTLLRTRGQPLFCSLEDDFCWSNLARGGAIVKLVPGSHENIFQEPNVRQLAKQLAESLTTAQARGLPPVHKTPTLNEIGAQ
jgi:amino acid adenylation domain-containing protein/FkbH-like protein